MKTKIDRQSWDREEVFDFFSQCSDPFYAIAFQQDVTKAVKFAKAQGLSFYMVMVWLMTKAVNSTENFRYEVAGDEVFLCDERIPSFTDLRPGSELFQIVTLPAGDDLKTFCRVAKEKSLHQNSFIDMSAEGDDLIYFSCVPGLALTAVTNEMDRNTTGYRDDSVPRIAWGKWTEKDGRFSINIAMEVNHRFIDGLHITRFSQKLDELIRGLEPAAEKE